MTSAEEQFDENKALIALRRQKLNELAARNSILPTFGCVLAAELQAAYGGKDSATLEAEPQRVAIAGRMLAKRIAGKASFARLRDLSGDMQLFIQEKRPVGCNLLRGI